MKFLIDTNVISAISPLNTARPEWIGERLQRVSKDLCISTITVVEIRDGIARATRAGATNKAAQLRQWWDAVERLYGHRVLSFDLEAAKIAGAMCDQARAMGQAPGLADIAIAATAKAQGLIVLTRNLKHFAGLGVEIIDPFTTPLE